MSIQSNRFELMIRKLEWSEEQASYYFGVGKRQIRHLKSGRSQPKGAVKRLLDLLLKHGKKAPDLWG